MSRYEGENVTNHVMGSAAPFMGIAMSQPLGVVAFFILLSALAVIVAIVRALVETSGTWGPYGLLALAGGILYAAHRWLWSPLAEDPRTPRRITASVVVAAACLLELCTGRAGILLGNSVGFNPEAMLMDAGLPVTPGIRSAITAWREDAKESAHCLASLAAGNMAQGTSSSVNWAQNCSRHIPLDDQRKACRLLDAQKGNDLSYVNESFCRSIAVYVTHRSGANWSY